MTTPEEAHSKQYCHINGSQSQVLDRFVVSELCKGWPVYRDNSEWMNYRSLFTDDAYVWTTWSGPRQIDDFISISKHGKANGSFIQHRENGTVVDLNPATDRAVGKMKATITQRFTSAPASSSDQSGPQATVPVAYDVDCESRFLFFCLRSPQHNNEWKVQYVKLIYEKDKVCPADGTSKVHFTQEELDRYPEGYKYLGAAQARLGYPVDPTLATLDKRYWGRMYQCMERWLDGDKDPGLFWDKEGVEQKAPV